MKKKLLFCSYDLNIGGIENALINLLDNMDYDKYDIDLILEKKEGVLFNKLNKNVNVIEYRVSESNNIVIRKFKNLFKRILWILKNYHRYDFSCCYATYSLPSNILAYYGSKNNILYIHSNYKYIYGESDLRNFFDVRRINKFKNVVFVSNEARNDLISFYPFLSKNSFVINNLINYDSILSLSKEKIDFKKRCKYLFVFVGRLEECSKKISRIINVVKKNDDIELIIIGDGLDYRKYKEMTFDCDRIYMVGAKKNPYPYMKIADYIVLSSDYEGFPVVYSEAIVLGKKIISTIDVSDDFISIPNNYGYIVSKDEDKMGNEIKDILKSDNLKYKNVDFKEVNSYKIKRIEDLIER